MNMVSTGEITGMSKGPFGKDGRANDRHAYDRERDLPRLLPLWPAEVADGSEAGRLVLLNRLRRALRAERQRGLAGTGRMI